jgi:hypothetical protein
MSMIGEGTITNLSAVECTIETDEPLQADQDVALCLPLPDQHESLPIERPAYGGHMPHEPESNSCKWNPLRTSGYTISSWTRWFNARKRFNQDVRLLNPVLSDHHQPP